MKIITGIKGFIRYLKRLRGIFIELDALQSISQSEHERIHDLWKEMAELSTLPNQLKALQALDVGFQQTGKIIIIAHVGGQDYVKIIDIPSRLTLVEWKSTVNEIEARYGAKARYADTIMGINGDYFSGRF